MAIRYQAWARLLLLISTHGIISLTHSRHSIPRYGRYKLILYLHILAGLFETFRFAFQDVWSKPSPAGLIDIILCYIQSGTNATLVWKLKMGIPKYTRPSYLTGAIIRPLLTTISYLLSSSNTQRSSIYLLDAFIYARLLIFLLRPFIPKYTSRYAIAITGSAVIASSIAGWAGANDGEGLWGAMRAGLGYLVVVGLLVFIREKWKRGLRGEGKREERSAIINRTRTETQGKEDRSAALASRQHPSRLVLTRSNTTDSDPDVYPDTPSEALLFDFRPHFTCQTVATKLSD